MMADLMKRLVVALLFGILALPVAARADEPVGCALTSAPLMAQPEGSVLIACMGGITEAFGGQLADVMTRILQSRLDLQAVMAQLDHGESISDAGVGRTVHDAQRHPILQALTGQPGDQIAITVHPLVD